eukprot:3539644-Rhodomonas_salina.8
MGAGGTTTGYRQTNQTIKEQRVRLPRALPLSPDDASLARLRGCLPRLFVFCGFLRRVSTLFVTSSAGVCRKGCRSTSSVTRFCSRCASTRS